MVARDSLESATWNFFSLFLEEKKFEWWVGLGLHINTREQMIAICAIILILLIIKMYDVPIKYPTPCTESARAPEVTLRVKRCLYRGI